MGGRVSSFFSLAGDGARTAEDASFSVTLAGKFELALREWHLTPEYILENWTDELFELMWEKRNERVTAEAEMIEHAHEEAQEGRMRSSRAKPMTDIELMHAAGIGQA